LLHISGEGIGLDHSVDSGGGNLSHGQRQLVCLGRMLLTRRHAKIAVFDEATSNVDDETDGRVGRAIQAGFVDQGCTTLSVAHRLATVRACGLLLVFDGGELVQSGTWDQLAGQDGGVFNSMAEAAAMPTE
jgi:ABC-type multidrug transport system fused ATPase/permease subunit